MVRGNSTEPVGEIAYAEVLWETTMQSTGVNVGDIVDPKVSVQDGYVHFMLPMEPMPGNALIAVKDVYGTILWSWHIWVADFDPVETQKKYNSGLVMMDRNLGATREVPKEGAEISDFSAYGLYYQWGRKDPLVMCAAVAPEDGVHIHDNVFTDEYNRIESTYKSPTHFYDDIDWHDDATLWQAEKTINDPCPAGWRVPSLVVWTSWYTMSLPIFGNYLYVTSPYSDSATYYPLAGYGDYTSSWPNDFYAYGHYWSVRRSETLRVWSESYCTSSLGVSNKASVRCMKDEKTPVTGGGKDYIIDDEYEW